MMFDPPDYPYKELNESIGNYYGPDLLFNTETAITTDSISTHSKDLLEVTEQMISNVESQLIFNSNDTEKFFDTGNAYLNTIDSNNLANTELYIIQSDNNIFNNENTFLDENTVNQFLLPTKPSETNTEVENSGPDLLSLHSCVICHEIFSTDIDLLDHTISVHDSCNALVAEVNNNLTEPVDKSQTSGGDIRASSCLEDDWMVCGICERVLSTAVEVVPTEGLCCNDAGGRSCVSSRKMDTMFVCDYCSGLFANVDALDKHRLTCVIQDQEPQPFYTEQTLDPNLNVVQNAEVCYVCESCGKQCSAATELKSHQLSCHTMNKRNIKRTYQPTNSKMWNCGSCNQLFSTARELYRHKRGEDRPAGAPLMAYVCEECDKVLGSMCALHTHKKMHKVSKPGYPCQVCGRRFNQSGHLAIHMRMHTGERPYPCDLCPKAFKVKVERDDHRRTHTGERPFACSSCPKTFTAAARLREHARIHTDQRPYQCDICGASFRRPYARTVHTLIHTGEKPHECDICGTSFRRSGDMWKHKRTLHGVQASGEDSNKS